MGLPEDSSEGPVFNCIVTESTTKFMYSIQIVCWVAYYLIPHFYHLDGVK